jgi:hypothetical protein
MATWPLDRLKILKFIVFNAFTHITAAIIAYQINPLPPQPIRAFVP